MSANLGGSLRQPHIALFPSAGMGHLTPFLRLAAMLSSRHCLITLITAHPTVSAAESDHITHFLAIHPEINRLDFQLLPSDPALDPTKNDPFFLQFEAISRSAHLLRPALSKLSPPLSAIFSDFVVAVDFTKVAAELRVPYYILITTSARFFSLMATLPLLMSPQEKNPSPKLSIGCGSIEFPFPGLEPLPESSLPPPLFIPDHLFTKIGVRNALQLSKATGILSNTFEAFEPETIAALNKGGFRINLPPLLPIGPLEPWYEQGRAPVPAWLDDQEAESVVYISFGSRTAMAKEQIKELADGLVRSGCRFLWVVKTSKVDKEESDDEVSQLLGKSFLEKTGNRGVVVKGWVSQEEILGHAAVGGFVSHCGWNSVTEAARRGVPVLAWPQHGDQRVNAEVVEKAGLGIWVREWGWGVEGNVVGGEEIGQKIEEVMGDQSLRAKAKMVGEEARKAWENGGSSDKALMEITAKLKPST